MKNKTKLILLGLFVACTFLIFYFIIFFPFTSAPVILNKIDHWNDPCYEMSSYKEKKKVDDYVCISDMPAKYCYVYSLGNSCERIMLGIKGADIETLKVHYGTLMSDKNYVYINGKQTDSDVNEFKLGENGIFYFGNSKYKMDVKGINYEKVK